MKAFVRGSSLLTWATILTVIATAGSVMSGCSLKPVGQHVIRVELPPDVPTVALATRDLASMLTDPGVDQNDVPPLTAKEFRCFALNVTGPGIPPEPKMHCSGSGEYIGKLAGFFPINHDGNTVMEVAVPAGPDRRVQLLAFTSTSGRCGSVFSEEESEDTGAPFALGEARVDLFTDTAVEIVASYDPATAQPAFQNCEDGGEGGSGDEGFVPIAAAFKGLALPSEEAVIGPFDLTGAAALAPVEISAISAGDGSSEALPLFTSGNSALAGGGLVSDVEGNHFPALQLRWDVTHLDPAVYPVLDLQLQVGFDLAGSCGGAIKGLQSVLLTDSGARLGHFMSYDFAGHTRNLRWNPFYRLYADHTVTINGRRMVVLNVYAQFDDYGGCTADVAIGFAHLKIPPELPQLKLNHGDEVLVSGRNTYVGAYGGMPPYIFSSSATGVFGDSVLYAQFVPGAGVSETVTVTDATGVSASKTFGVARFKTLGPAGLSPGCNPNPIMFEMQVDGVPVAVNKDESISISYPSNFYIEFYEQPDCSSQVFNADIPAGGSSSQSLYVKVISGFGLNLEISGNTASGGAVDPHSASYLDAACSAPGSVMSQSSAGGATPCDSLKKAQSFVPQDTMKLSSISLSNAIEMWPYPSAPSNVNVAIYSDAGGQPGGPLVLSSCLAPQGFFDSECLAVFAPTPQLNAFTKYWIVVWHPTAGVQFCWQGSNFDSHVGGEAQVYIGSWQPAPVMDFMFRVNACAAP